MNLPQDFIIALTDTLEHEGGWSDNPNDPGGATWKGVTKKAWEAYVGYRVTKDMLHHLTDDQVAAFYYKKYWLAAKCDKLPMGINVLIFDIAVNSGPGRAAKILQDSLNRLTRMRLAKDGIIGRKTLEITRRVDVIELIEQVAYRRLTFYSQLRTFKFFANGWRKRAISTAVYATQVAMGNRAAIIKGTKL